MGDDRDALPEPGWYDDPTGGAGQRYWDGAGWTADTRTSRTAGSPEPARRGRRGALLAGAFVAVLAVGVGVGLLVAGQPESDPDTESALAEPAPTGSEEPELPIALQLVAEMDRPTDRQDAVLFTDVAALRAAGTVPGPEAGSDGWSSAFQVGSTGALPVLDEHYFAFLQLRRPVPMEYVYGLTFDEILASVGSWGGHWLVPEGGEDTVRGRLRTSGNWSEIDAETFERSADFTADSLDGYEADSIERRSLDAMRGRVTLRDGALRLDDGARTDRGDPLGQDPAWSAVLERLAGERAVSGALLPHDALTALPDGGTPLEPAAAMAMAAVIDGDGLSDLLVLEYDDSAAAAANAEAARTNLERYAAFGDAEGEVEVDGTAVLVRLRLTGDLAGTSDLFSTVRRLPRGPLNLVIGVGDATDDHADTAQAPGDAPLQGSSITVASKDFDEQLILGEISVALLENAGANVTNEVNLGGTDATRAALETGEIDHYWEYTGTAWISFFGETELIRDRLELFRAVRDREAAENGLFWLEPSAFNNTYGIALSQEADAQLGGVDTISEMAQLLRSDPGAVTLCVESGFAARDDGLPGMEADYGFATPDGNVTVMDPGPIYGAVADRDPCTFGEVFTTDGRIAALDLKVLEDDRVFFPLYNAAPVFTEDIWIEYGRTLEELYAPVAGALRDDTMRELNARVSADGQRPADVAREWLTDNGFID